jgi:hypothetical protein
MINSMTKPEKICLLKFFIIYLILFTGKKRVNKE